MTYLACIAPPPIQGPGPQAERAASDVLASFVETSRVAVAKSGVLTPCIVVLITESLYVFGQPSALATRIERLYC